MWYKTILEWLDKLLQVMEIADSNRRLGDYNVSTFAGGRRLTTIGVFRRYPSSAALRPDVSSKNQ